MRRECSALLRRLRHETTELRHDLRAFALRALHVTLLPLRDGHDHFEWLVALLAHELIARHGTSVALSSSLPTAVSIQAEKLDGGGPATERSSRAAGAPPCLPGGTVLGAHCRRLPQSRHPLAAAEQRRGLGGSDRPSRRDRDGDCGHCDVVGGVHDYRNVVLPV